MDLMARRCGERGIPGTAPRRAILETVLGMENHPTADQVHAEVARTLTGLNRTTVYRTLETLVSLGLLTRLCHPGRAIRFDPRTSVHHHLVCLRCDSVVDFEDARLDELPVPDTSGRGFELHDYRVQLRGVCQQCQTKEFGP
jgi:Fe2+ or Zn2+ uptake regulation protein